MKQSLMMMALGIVAVLGVPLPTHAQETKGGVVSDVGELRPPDPSKFYKEPGDRKSTRLNSSH